MFAALTDTPACSYEVVRDPGWPVTLVGTLPNAVVIARLLSAASGKSTGSDQTAAPVAIVVVAVPENDSAVSLLVSMVLLTGIAGQTATCAWLIVTGPSPNPFEKRTRIWLPPS